MAIGGEDVPAGSPEYNEVVAAAGRHDADTIRHADGRIEALHPTSLGMHPEPSTADITHETRAVRSTATVDPIKISAAFSRLYECLQVRDDARSELDQARQIAKDAEAGLQRVEAELVTQRAVLASARNTAAARARELQDARAQLQESLDVFDQIRRDYAAAYGQEWRLA